ncbi:hypothetical protein LCGC14_1422870, partial [marine sediment metagenome]
MYIMNININGVLGFAEEYKGSLGNNMEIDTLLAGNEASNFISIIL